MVSLRLKVGSKGQIVIPKLLRDKYGIKEGEEVIVDLRDEGILIRRKPTSEEIISSIEKYRKMIKDLGVSGAPGDLKKIYLEEEFE